LKRHLTKKTTKNTTNTTATTTSFIVDTATVFLSIRYNSHSSMSLYSTPPLPVLTSATHAHTTVLNRALRLNLPTYPILGCLHDEAGSSSTLARRAPIERYWASVIV